ncbi:MAG: MazG nucleotide pyrophosphohydrolase domain [Sedimentibacter sp.]|jgi:NTP pyrophosphatase (non-canonical NTP hydrolase)|nr:MazG nucleotide pyrophosphohydrolase domain [Sedimentibacter sp.]
MDGNTYQALAMRTNDGKAAERLNAYLDSSNFTDPAGILNAALGLTGEVGELEDMIKKHIFHQKPIDEDHVKREIGDICWYIAMVCESAGYDLDEIMQMNVDKLRARYPEGFDVVRANNRATTDN